MKHVIMKKISIVAIALLAVPGLLMAQQGNNQKDKEKDKDKKEKTETKQIIITRTGDKDEKIVVEVDGDNVKINGKDAKDYKGDNVHVNTIKGPVSFSYHSGSWNSNNWNDDDQMSIFTEDENRAMLGVNTEGNDKGAEIISVVKESGAEKAGLKKGDILTKVADRKIESTDDVTEEVRSHKPGEKISITYLRDGKENKVTAELGKWKGIQMNAVSVPRIEAMGRMMDRNERIETPVPPGVYSQGFSVYGNRPKLGLSIQDTDDGNGVKVLDVDDDSNADKAGLKEDDIIVSIDGQDVKSTDDVVKATRPTKDKFTYNLKVLRNGKTQNIELKIPRKLKTTEL